MKKNYQSPEMLTVLLANEDVLTTSLTGLDAGDLDKEGVAWDFNTKFGQNG